MQHRRVDVYIALYLQECKTMHAQLAASIRHLKQAATHLHDAKLIIGTVNTRAAEFIERLLQATREQVRELELLHDKRD